MAESARLAVVTAESPSRSSAAPGLRYEKLCSTGRAFTGWSPRRVAANRSSCCSLLTGPGSSEGMSTRRVLVVAAVMASHSRWCVLRSARAGAAGHRGRGRSGRRSAQLSEAVLVRASARPRPLRSAPCIRLLTTPPQRRRPSAPSRPQTQPHVPGPARSRSPAADTRGAPICRTALRARASVRRP
jgi:hypothetical protein